MSNRSDRRTKRYISTTPLSLWICVGLLFFVLMVTGAVLMVTSPTQPDAVHTIAFNNHGITHYCRPIIFYGTAAMGGGIVLYVLVGLGATVILKRKYGIDLMSRQVLSRWPLFGKFPIPGREGDDKPDEGSDDIET